MSEKFNQLIELFIAEEQDKAKELFHELVVDKSREIYENLIDEKDLEDVTETEKDDDDEAPVEESVFDEEQPMGGDASDDLMATISDGIDQDEQGLTVEDDDEEDLEDRVVDLEDALDDLKAEFEQIMAGEEGEEELALEPELDGDEEGEEELAFGDEELAFGDEEGEEGEEEELEDSINPNMVREYTEKVTPPSKTEEGNPAVGPVAGANKMGGTAHNIVPGSSEEKGRTAPTAKVQTTSTPVTGKLVAATKPVTKSAESKSASPVRKA